MFAILPEVRLTIHQAAGLIHFSTVILSVIKSKDWGISPLYVALFQSLSFCYAVFFVLSLYFSGIAAWVVRRFQAKPGQGPPKNSPPEGVCIHTHHNY